MSANELDSVAADADRQWTVRRGTAELAVFEWGDPEAEALVLVHGLPDTHVVWRSVVPLLTDRFRVVAYDTRGMGASTSRGRVADFRLDELAADFFAVIDAVSPGAPVHVVAHDWGAVQVWEAVCTPRSNRRVASFTSVAGPNLDHMGMWMRSADGTAVRNVWGPLTQLVSSLYALVFTVPVAPRLFLRLAGTARTWKWLLRRVEGISGRDAHVAPTVQADMITGLKMYRANVLRGLWRPREKYTAVPVQLLVGTRDPILRPAGFDTIGHWASRYERHDIPAGHWIPLSDPLVVAEAATNFADSQRVAVVA